MRCENTVFENVDQSVAGRQSVTRLCTASGTEQAHSVERHVTARMKMTEQRNIGAFVFCKPRKVFVKVAVLEIMPVDGEQLVTKWECQRQASGTALGVVAVAADMIDFERPVRVRGKKAVEFFFAVTAMDNEVSIGVQEQNTAENIGSAVGIGKHQNLHEFFSPFVLFSLIIA